MNGVANPVTGNKLDCVTGYVYDNVSGNKRQGHRNGICECNCE